MIEFARHIEILLLDNDCVIVPGFGGFITNLASSRREVSENQFLPPYRTIGFNPAMKLNDGLLVQSYMVAYDASYPEAVRLVESKVNSLIGLLEANGSYELHGIGTLFQDINGKYSFTPIEAGLLSPTIYGLSSFEFLALDFIIKQEENEKLSHEIDNSTKKKETVLEPTFLSEEKAQVIDIKVNKRERYINIVAACISIVLLSLLALPFTNIGKSSSEMMKQTIAETVSKKDCSIITKVIDAINTDASTPKGSLEKVSGNKEIKEKLVSNKKTQIIETKTNESISKEETTDLEQMHSTYYTLVLASQVSRKNAEKFIENLSKRSNIQAEIMEGNFISIIFSHFKTQGEAYQKLKELNSIPEFKQAWVKEIK